MQFISFLIIITVAFTQYISLFDYAFAKSEESVIQKNALPQEEITDKKNDLPSIISTQEISPITGKEHTTTKAILQKTISKKGKPILTDKNTLPFTLFQFEPPENKQPALLVIAGIQGDEPGAFSAAALLATRYTFHSGALWIVPNLNFPSILSSNRGISDDMNRKFASISKNDSDYTRVQDIKEIILDNNVDFIYHMHDGSGFYRPSYISPQFSPKRWGQCIIIDQENLDKTVAYSNLEKLSSDIIKKVNKSVLDKLHIYHLHNTRTKEGNKEMERSLTWFVIKNGKAAIASEASKNFSLTKRVYYHLLALEALLEERGITFTRDFPLTTAGVWNALYDVNVTLSDSFYLPLKDVRPRLSYIPIKAGVLQFSSDNPLVHVEQNPRNKKEYLVRYGNRLLTRLSTEKTRFADPLKDITVFVDGKHTVIPLSSVVRVNQSFSVPSLSGYRANIIGYTKKNVSNEFDILVRRQDLLSQYSVDKKARTFRVELYKESMFVGIFYVQFP